MKEIIISLLTMRICGILNLATMTDGANISRTEESIEWDTRELAAARLLIPRSLPTPNPNPNSTPSSKGSGLIAQLQVGKFIVKDHLVAEPSYRRVNWDQVPEAWRFPSMFYGDGNLSPIDLPGALMGRCTGSSIPCVQRTLLLCRA